MKVLLTGAAGQLAQALHQQVPDQPPAHPAAGSHPLAPGAAAAAGGRGMSSTAKEIGHLRTVEQAQEALELASMGGRWVELEGKSASIKSISIKSISDSIQSSNACSFPSCLALCSSSSSFRSSSFSRISLSGSRRQLSIDKNERKGGNDEPDAPLLLERELAVGEADVVIGGIQSDQTNNAANDGFNQGLAVKAKPPPGRCQDRFLRIDIHPTQPGRKTTASSLVHLNYLRNGRGPGGGFARAGSGRRAGFCGRAAGAVLKTLQESSERHTTCGVCFGGW
jgi:hypothetical protein